MGMFEHSLELEVLRATAIARISLQAGVGLESVVHALASAPLPRLGRIVRPLLAELQAGEEVFSRTRAAAERAEAKGMRPAAQLLRCLLAEGSASLRRLGELTEELRSDRESRLLAYCESLQGKVQFATILLVVAMFPVLLRIPESIPPNSVIPALNLPTGFIEAAYAVLALVYGSLLVLGRYRDEA